jgi:PAP2 superfamily
MLTPGEGAASSDAALAAAQPAPVDVPSRRWGRELLFVLGFYAIYDAVRGVTTGSLAQAQRDGYSVLSYERLVHLDPEHWLNDSVQRVPALAVPACFFYATLHFVITPAVLIWTYRYRPNEYRQARTVLALITLAALAGFWWYPTAPPRLLAGAGFHDTLSQFSNWGWWGADASVPAPAAAIGNQFAAMPSLHVAWAAWCAATACRLTRHKVVHIAALAYPVLTALVVLATANHYLLDVLAGVALWGAGHVSIGYLHRIGTLPSGWHDEKVSPDPTPPTGTVGLTA